MRPAPGDRPPFPPEDALLLTALACDRPRQAPDPRKQEVPVPSAPPRPPYQPLSRFSVTDVCEQANSLGLPISYSTVWRRLHDHALRPWFQHQWLFPRDPRLLERATPVLELYQGYWQGEPLGLRDVVLCADAMTGLQAVSRTHVGTPTQSDRRSRFEFEYERHGALCYTAFLDVRTGQVWGRTSASDTIAAFEASLTQCLALPRYQQVERVFLILDNGSSHHPSTSPARLQARFPTVTTVHLPTHSSWLNQIELYFSILSRKALTPRDFPDLAALRERLTRFEGWYNLDPRPFRWQFGRKELEEYVIRLARHEQQYQAAAARLLAQRQEAQSLPIH
jgi:transposase InsO family protein